MSPKQEKAQKSNKAVKQVKQSENSPMPVLGYTVWWTIRDITATIQEMEERVDKTFGRSYMPDSPSPNKVVRNTLEAIAKRGLITRIPNGSDSKIAYTLHHKEVDNLNLDLDLEKDQTLIYDKTSDTVQVKTEYKKAEIMDLMDKFSKLYTDDDIRMVVGKYLQASGAVTMRETGGIYFTSEKDVRDKLEAFIVSNGGSFYSLKVYDEDADKATMHAIVKNELDNDLQLAAEELKQYLQSRAESDTKGRIDALEGRIEKFKTIRAKAELYKGLLENDIEELSKQVETISDEVRQALSGELESYPQAAQFPLRSKVVYSGRSTDKYGSTGVVLGYFTSSREKTDKYNGQYCRVRFDQSEKIVAVGVHTLKLATEEAEQSKA